MTRFLAWLASFRLRILLRTSFLLLALGACAHKPPQAIAPERSGQAVAAGVEARAARDSGHVIIAEEDGVISKVDAAMIEEAPVFGLEHRVTHCGGDIRKLGPGKPPEARIGAKHVENDSVPIEEKGVGGPVVRADRCVVGKAPGRTRYEKDK